MSKPYFKSGLVVLIFATLSIFGCSTAIHSPATPSPTPSASPTPTPTVSEAMSSAGEDLTRALSELRSRNVRGSLEMVDRSIASLKIAAAGATAASRQKIDEAIKKLEASREMIANSDKKADEALAKAEQSVTGLVSSVSAMVDEAKEGAARAIGKAADKVKEAVGAPSPTASPSPRKR